MTLILSNDDVERLLTMPDCIDALESAYVELADGRGVSRTRTECLAPTKRPDALYSMTSTDSVVPGHGIVATRLTSDIVTWPVQGGIRKRVKIASAPGKRYVGLVLLFSSETGEPLAIFPDGVIQRMRVGATNGLGVKHLARKDACAVGLIGAGWQAGAQLMAVCAVRPVTSIRCFSPNAESRAAFAASMTKTLGVEVVPVVRPEDAVAGADIVMCATSSIDNVFFARWIAPGMHISSIKRPELEAAVVQRAERLVIHTRDWTPLVFSAKDVVTPETTEARGWQLAEGLDIKDIPTLPELIAGRAAGRGADDEVTCFVNNQGIGYQFAAVGSVVYRKAVDNGLGRDLPTEWFTEDVHN